MPAIRSVTLISLVLCAAPAFAREIGSFDRTLTVAGTADPDVQTNSGRIAVRSGGGNSVHVRGTINIPDSAAAVARCSISPQGVAA